MQPARMEGTYDAYPGWTFSEYTLESKYAIKAADH